MHHHPALLDMLVSASERPSFPARHDAPAARPVGTATTTGGFVHSLVVSVHNLFRGRPARTA